MDIKRLVDVFESSKNFENPNNESLHWLGFHLDNKENFLRGDLIKNFRQNLSLGRDDAMYRKSYLNLQEISEWTNHISEDILINNLSNHNIGNSLDVILHQGKYYDYNKFFQIYYYSLINQYLSSKSICFEIGAGYGALAEVIINNKDSKYFIIDLLEANLITSYYLNKVFTNKKIFLFDDYLSNGNIIGETHLSNFDIFILPPNLNFDDSIKFDFFINTRSMMEMDSGTINDYFNFIHKYSHAESFFLNVNRYEKITVGERICLSDYPYDKNWNTKISIPAFKQDHIHLLLTQRSSENGDIKEELKKIEELGKQFYEKRFSFSKLKFSLQRIILNIFGRRFLEKIIKLKRKFF